MLAHSDDPLLSIERLNDRHRITPMRKLRGGGFQAVSGGAKSATYRSPSELGRAIVEAFTHAIA